MAATALFLWATPQNQAHAQGVTGAVEATGSAEQKVRLYGFGLNTTFWFQSGVTGPADSYENVKSILIEPNWQIGKLLIKRGYWSRLSLSARAVVSREFAGNDASFRGSQYASPALFAAGGPEAIILSQNGLATTVPGSQIDGTDKHFTISDMWLNVNHGSLVKIPKIGVNVSGNLRMVLPTSFLSRNAGLIMGMSPSIALSRTFLKRFTAIYATRFTKFWWQNTTQNVRHLEDPVNVNGQLVTPYQPETSGVLNSEYSVWNAFILTTSITPKLTLDTTFLLMHSFTYPNNGSCSVPGVPGANVCTSGQMVGDVIGPGERGQRDSMWFLAEVSYQFFPWFGLGVGVSTFTPVRKEGLGIANPFFRTIPTANVTMLYLSAAISFDKLYTTLRKN